MSDVKTSTSSSGIGFTGLLTLIFITLKLCNVITWSWWWVLSPIWISVALTVGLLALFIGVPFAVAGIALLVEWIKSKSNEKERE